MVTRRRVPILLVSLFAAPALGQTSGMLSFQGLIKDAGGNPINGAATLEFNVFSASAGGSLQAGPFGPTAVTATDGIVSTKFGPVPASVFNGAARWLEVKVNGVALSRLEMAEPPATAEQVNRPGTGSAAIRVHPTTGAVGIGTTPLSGFPLQIRGTSNTADVLVRKFAGSGAGQKTMLRMDVFGGTPVVAGFGGRMLWSMENAAGALRSTVGSVGVIWSDPATNDSDMVFSLSEGGTFAEKMRLTSAGNLQSASLDVVGDTKLNGDVRVGGRTIYASGTGPIITAGHNNAVGFEKRMWIGHSTINPNWGIQYRDLSSDGFVGDQIEFVAGNTTRPSFGFDLAGRKLRGFNSSGVGTVLIDAGIGRVGIGTTNPGDPLHVVGDIRGDRFIDGNNTTFFLDPSSTGTSLDIAGSILMDTGEGIFVSSGNLLIDGQNLDFRIGGSVADDVFVSGDVAIAGKSLFMSNRETAADGDQNIWFTDLGSVTASYIRWDDVAGLACGTNIGNIDSAFIWNIGDGSNSGWSFNNGTDSEFMVDELGNTNMDGSLTNGGGCDIAEAFLGTDDLPPGTLVVLDPLQPEGVIASSFAYENGIVGVVSTVPGILMRGPTADVYPLHEEMQGLRAMLTRSDEERAILEELEAMQLEETEDGAVAASSARRAGLIDRIAGFEAGRAELVILRNELEQTIDNWTRGNINVALLGRVPVRVVGVVRAGDQLTASDTPGVAMAQVESGPTIGIALEDYAGGGEGKVVTLIQPGWYGGAAAPVRAAADGADLRRLQAENVELQQRLSEMESRLKALEDNTTKVAPSERSSAVDVVNPALAMVGLLGLVVVGRNRKGGA